jgi:spectinomycin phosphotransferase
VRRVFTRPDSLADDTVVAALRDGWGIDAAAADYLPAGFGSHHWVATGPDGSRQFVTVDDLASRDFLGADPAAAFPALDRAFSVASVLYAGGLDWVVAARRTSDGHVLRWLDGRYSIAVFPYVEGTSSDEYAGEAERNRVVSLLVQLHQSAKGATQPARTETLRLPNRADLEAALAALDGCWTGGPYAEPARSLLRRREGEVRRALVAYDQLAQRALRTRSRWTITHGEPHSRNVIRTRDGLRLIDWDTALVAPPERDLWMLVEPTATDRLAQHYGEATGHRVDRDALALYALSWDLSELGIYVAQFRAAHGHDADVRVAWRGFQESVEAVTRASRQP